MSGRHSWYVGGVLAAAALGATFYVVCSGVAWLRYSDGPSEAERQERLEADRERLRQQRELIAALVAELAEGRLTLREAAAQLRAENERGPRRLDLHIEHLPGQTDEERYCRSVLAHAQAVLADDPRAEPVLERLEAELGPSLMGPQRPAHAWSGRRPAADGA